MSLECGWRHARKRWPWEFEEFEKVLETKQKFNQRDKHLGSPSYKILGTIPKMNKRRTQTRKEAEGTLQKTITDADYTDDIAILPNTPKQAKHYCILRNKPPQALASMSIAHKTECMCFNQTGDISPLDRSSLKLVDKFTYLGSRVSSTEKDIDTRLSIIWKSNLTDKMKRSFFQAAVVSILLHGCTTWTLTKRLEKKLDGNYTRMLRAILDKS